MMIVFFDIRGVIIIEWVAEDHTINRNYYFGGPDPVLRTRKKRPKLWKKKSRTLHQDNATSHSALAVKQFLADKRIPVPEHPHSYLAPYDFYLFSKLKSALKATHFQSVDEVKSKTA
jgi:hypothetical protein